MVNAQWQLGADMPSLQIPRGLKVRAVGIEEKKKMRTITQVTT